MRWLVGSTIVRAGGGEAAEAIVTVPRRRFAYWQDAWTYEPGDYTLRIGTNVLDLPKAVKVHLA